MKCLKGLPKNVLVITGVHYIRILFHRFSITGLKNIIMPASSLYRGSLYWASTVTVVVYYLGTFGRKAITFGFQ